MAIRSTILALDDNEITLKTYQLCFKRAGHRILVSGRSDQAISLAQQHHPQLALINAALAKEDSKDGYSVCRELRSGKGPAPAVFLVTSDVRSVYDRLRAFEAGAVAFYDQSVPLARLQEDVNFFLRNPTPFLQLSGKNGASARSVGTPVSLHDLLRVVIVDDDREQTGAISMALEAEGISPYVAHSARQGIILSHRVSPDVIILDMDLPDMNGGEALSSLKAHSTTKNIPVIIWTGSERRGQELTCMKDGAARYLVKGVHEVVAIPLHVRACLGDRPGPDEERLQMGPVALELASRLVSVSGKRVEGLTPKEFELLTYIMRRSPKIVSWTDIERDVWKLPQILRTKTHAPKTIVVHLNELKKKLGGGARCMVTHRGHGIQFDPSAA